MSIKLINSFFVLSVVLVSKMKGVCSEPYGRWNDYYDLYNHYNYHDRYGSVDRFYDNDWSPIRHSEDRENYGYYYPSHRQRQTYDDYRRPYRRMRDHEDEAEDRHRRRLESLQRIAEAKRKVELEIERHREIWDRSHEDEKNVEHLQSYASLNSSDLDSSNKTDHIPNKIRGALKKFMGMFEPNRRAEIEHKFKDRFSHLKNRLDTFKKKLHNEFIPEKSTIPRNDQNTKNTEAPAEVSSDKPSDEPSDGSN